MEKDNIYFEEIETGNEYRNEYLSGLNKLVENRRMVANTTRTNFTEDILKNQEMHRKKFINMLGWPLNEQYDIKIPHVKKTLVAKDDFGCIYRLQIEIFKDFWFYGLLFVTDEQNPNSLVIVQHGGSGTPELCSGFQDSANYNNITRRVLKKGVNVFAPQMLLWDEEKNGNKYDRTQIDVQLKQLGGSITALEIFCLQRSIDYLQTLHFIDKNKIAMVGLSYGGFYTLLMSAVDTRIKSCISSCFFNNRYKYDWSDWTWFNAANTFLDSEIGALVCPRILHIEIGNVDDLFDVEFAIKEFNTIKKYFDQMGAKDKLRITVFDGTHEFNKNDNAINLMIDDLK